MNHSIWEVLQEGPCSSRNPKRILAFPLIERLQHNKIRKMISNSPCITNKTKVEESQRILDNKFESLPGLKIIEYNLLRSNLQYKKFKNTQNINICRKKHNSLRKIPD